MAGPRQPLALIEAKGRKHLTKEEKNKRKAEEVHAESDHIVAPSYLNAKQKREFRKISDELKRAEIMSNLDSDCLARYIMAETMYRDTCKKLNDEQIRNDIFMYEKMANLNDKFFKQCQGAAKELGLTISSRCRLIVPKKDEEKKENKFITFVEGAKSG